MKFIHNHPIVCAHSLSFRSISEKTKEAFFKLFDEGHSAASARHMHEQCLLIDAATEESKQFFLADRAINPSVQDICRLFSTVAEEERQIAHVEEDPNDVMR